MDKEKLKLIVRNLKSLVEILESEVHSDPDSYMQPPMGIPMGDDYDELWSDDDGYPD